LKSKKNFFIYLYIYSQKSFEDIDLWLKDLKLNSSPDIKIFLVGNKADLEESREINKERAQKYKVDYDLDYFLETSAKTGMNAQEIFIQAAQALYKDYIEYRKDKKKTEDNNNKNNTKTKLNENNDKKDSKNGCC